MTSIEFDIPLYFRQEDKLFKRIIKEQGVTTCRDEFMKEYINSSLQSFIDGFIILGKIINPKTSYRTPSSNYLLKGFILFSFDGFGNTINGKILCARKGYHIGKMLLQAVFDYAINKDITYWHLYSLPYEKLIKFYQSFGFSIGNPVYRKGELKVVEMFMSLPEKTNTTNDCFMSCPTEDPNDFLYLDEFDDQDSVEFI